MRTIIVTGSAGLIGSESVRRFARDGARVLGIDNDMRAEFFGAEASTKKTRDDLIAPLFFRIHVNSVTGLSGGSEEVDSDTTPHH